MKAFGIRIITAIVDFSGRRPWIVLAAFAVFLALTANHARGIDVRSDLAELLPRDSPAFRAFEHQAGRAGGSSMLIVIVSSPDRQANERFVDALAVDLEELAKRRPDLVSYVESSTRDIRSYYEANKWLYADLAELERIDGDLDHQIAIRGGLVEDLDRNDDALPLATTPATEKKREDALGMNSALDRWKERVNKKDSFPTGYFSARDGTLVGIRIASNASLGGSVGDDLLRETQKLTTALVSRDPSTSGSKGFKDITVGFTGDIASAAGEKKALVSEAAMATLIAIGIILLALVLYFRSFWSLIVIAVPVAIGVTTAYAFARIAFGYVNAAGAFLGAIIIGNGINYPIVLFARYREFRALGMSPEVARRESVINALRAELVGACVASIAYGSLAVTQFRGFRQFGLIGFVGMLLVWASIIPVVPALISVVERFGGLRNIESGKPGWIAKRASRIATARPMLIIAIATVLAIVAIIPIPRWIGDPWEYDFGKLGSRSSDVSGAGEWSNKANEVFGGKMNIAGALMIADSPEQVPLLKKQILDNDARDPKGKMIAEIVTIDDALPGTASEQKKKLDVLERIRGRLTPRVLHDLSPEERKTIDEACPPESLRVLEPSDLPGLLKRRFMERSGAIGTVFYVKPHNEIVFADGHNHMRLSATTDNVRLPDGTIVMTASRSTIFAEMLASLRRDGPLATAVSFFAVAIVVALLARSRRVTFAVLGALMLGVLWLLGGAAAMGARLNYVNFIALPITFGIGCEYPFNLADRVRLLKGDVAQAVTRSSGAVLLCSFTTMVGYGSLMLSDFQALESFGKLAVLGELACVFAAVLVMPSVMLLMARRKHSQCLSGNGFA